MRRIKSLSDLERWRQDILGQRAQYDTTIYVCGGTGCQAYDCQKVKAAFQREIKEKRLEAKVSLKITGCPGFCERGPLVTIQPQNIFYQKVKPLDVSQIVSETIEKKRMIEHLLFEDPKSHQKFARASDIPFYKPQMRLILSQNELIDPNRIEDYVAIGGYQTFAKAISKMSPMEIIEEIK